MRQIFLGGCERSGTTMLASMLGGHSACLTIPESQFKIDILRPDGSPETADQLRMVGQRLIDNWRFKAWEVDLDPEIIPWDDLGASYAKLYEWIVCQYGLKVGKNNFQYWVDQTPENLKTFGTFIKWFPEAKGIHIIRDGRAVSASVIPLDWGPNTMIGSAYDWSQKVLTGLTAEAALGSERIYQIRYEALVANPEEEMTNLCNWLGIEFEDQILNNDGYSKPGYYNYKAHNLIGKKTDKDRAHAWRTKSSNRDIEIFESQTGELLEYLGYELVYGLKARKINGKDILLSAVQELLWELTNRIRGLIRIRRTVR